ncbi:MAG: hypothetical protein K9H48_07695 [Melioribacteraceae bacterium]|nr:hypothetical protein [Melioribacteraceae bacterium]
MSDLFKTDIIRTDKGPAFLIFRDDEYSLISTYSNEDIKNINGIIEDVDEHIKKVVITGIKDILNYTKKVCSEEEYLKAESFIYTYM